MSKTEWAASNEKEFGEVIGPGTVLEENELQERLDNLRFQISEKSLFITQRKVAHKKRPDTPIQTLEDFSLSVLEEEQNETTEFRINTE